MIFALMLMPFSVQATIDIANTQQHTQRSSSASKEYTSELTPLFPVTTKITQIIGTMQAVDFTETEAKSYPEIDLIQPLISQDIAERLNGKGGYEAYPVLRDYVENDLMYNSKKDPVRMQQKLLNANARAVAASKEGLKFAKVSEALSNKGYEESKNQLARIESAGDFQHKFAQESNQALYGLRQQQILNLIMAKRLENLSAEDMRWMAKEEDKEKWEKQQSLHTDRSPQKSSERKKPLEIRSFSKDEEISKLNFTHGVTSDTSLGYLQTGSGIDAGAVLSNPGNIISMASKGLEIAGQLGMDFGLSSMFGGAMDLAGFLSGDSTSGCAVTESTRGALLAEELQSNVEKMTEYSNLTGTTKDVMASWGEEKQNAVSVLLSDAKGAADDYKDLVKFENDAIGEQSVYGLGQPSLAAARQYVNKTFYYDAATGKKIAEGGKSPEDLSREVSAARLAYLNEAIINSLGASYAYSSVGVEESGKREKDLVERMIKAKNWDEIRAAQALADLNVVRERIVNLSLQMRLLEQMAITNINTTENAWVVPVSTEKVKENTRERMGQ